MGSLFPFFGVNFIFWGLISLMRFVVERLDQYWRNTKIFYPATIITKFVILIVFADLGALTAAVISETVVSPGFIFLVVIIAAAAFALFVMTVALNEHRRRILLRVNLTLAGKIKPSEVAAVIPAHNEAKTIARTINSLQRVVRSEQIFVGSDASTDNTIAIARSLGVAVEDIRPNRGKAGVLQYVIEKNGLSKRFRAIMFVDADSEVSDDYLDKALPVFDNPEVAAIAVHALSKWEDHWPLEYSRFFAAYRIRFYRVLQAVMRYGQAWQPFNVVPIVPGFASIYRAEILQSVEINAPGLVIEDFNMTFEVHHKKLGRVAYLPEVRGMSRDPLRLRDYIKQVKRWNLGFWQTVRRHGVWSSYFCCALAIFLAEMLLLGGFFLAWPLLVAVMLVVPEWSVSVLLFSTFSVVEVTISVTAILFLTDYLLTVVVALYERKPILLIYGLGFLALRYIDNFLFLYTLPLAFIKKSDGRWVSPKR